MSGGSTTNWTVVEVDRDQAVLDVEWGTAHWRATFDRRLPVPLKVDDASSDRFEYRRTSILHEVPAQHGPPDPIALAPARFDAALFAAPAAHPFSFKAASQAWETHEEYQVAIDWWDAHPDHRLVWLDYTVYDENSGSATVYHWHGRYYDNGSLLNVGIGWRITHPSPTVAREYPLYDACPDGCLEPYGGRPRVAELDIPGDEVDWPSQGITTASAIERLRSLGETGEVSRISWRLASDEPGLDLGRYAPEPTLRIFTGGATSDWDMAPDPPNAWSGRLASASTRGDLWFEQVVATGDLLGIQTRARPF